MSGLEKFQKFRCSVPLAFVFCTTFSLPVIAQAIPASVNTATPAIVRSAYILGSGDQIDITVFDYAEFTGTKVILPDGTITMPVIGAIPVAGKTTEQLARELTSRLSSSLVNPVVTISLVVLRPVVVNIAGEVQRPGPIQLRSTTGSTAGSNNASGSVPTVSTALAQAGGITPNADIRQVVVRRVLPDGNYTRITVDLWNAILSDAATQDIVLQADDTVFVPRLAADATIDRRLIARSSFSPAIVRVRVVGEVNAPGQIEISPDSSLSSAIASAGGPTEDARLREVALIRMGEDGGVSTQKIDLRNLNDSYQVQEGDVVVVPKQGSSSFLRGLGQVLTPFGSILNIFNQLF